MYNYKKYFIQYNNMTNLDYNIHIAYLPPKPSPTMQYEEVLVPGASKALYREIGYAPIEIAVEFHFISKRVYLWDKDFRKAKHWLLDNENKILKFCDDLEGFYKVNKVTIQSPTRELKKLGKFIAIFTCDPHFYLDCDEQEIITGQTIHNPYEVSRPIYRITGNGELTLTINNKPIKVNVGQEVKIDTELGLTYRDGQINNVSLTGNYEDLYLQEGENTFTLTPTDPQQAFQVFVTPNWRCL